VNGLCAVRGLCKRHGTRTVLDGAAFELEAGAAYVLTGDNGAGKSTLLRILGGLERADAGTMRFDGRALDLAAGYPAGLRAQILYVHQHPYLFQTSVAGNIGYGLARRGVGRAERERLVAEAIDWAGLGAVAGTPPHRLSGGERQRVALARARALSPRLYLFDEPTASLDAAARRRAVALIERLKSDRNCVVVACHDRELIELPNVRRLELADGTIAAS
jgi:tungstate transport system ATP-binding protein